MSFLPMAHRRNGCCRVWAARAGVATAYASSMSRLLDELSKSARRCSDRCRAFLKRPTAKSKASWKRGPLAVRCVCLARETSIARACVCFIAAKKYRCRFRLPTSWLIVCCGAKSAAFGGRCAISSSEPRQRPKMLEFFWPPDCRFEVYGMTEATTVTHFNTLQNFKLRDSRQVDPGLNSV